MALNREIRMKKVAQVVLVALLVATSCTPRTTPAERYPLWSCGGWTAKWGFGVEDGLRDRIVVRGTWKAWTQGIKAHDVVWRVERMGNLMVVHGLRDERITLAESVMCRYERREKDVTLVFRRLER